MESLFSLHKVEEENIENILFREKQVSFLRIPELDIAEEYMTEKYAELRHALVRYCTKKIAQEDVFFSPTSYVPWLSLGSVNSRLGTCLVLNDKTASQVDANMSKYRNDTKSYPQKLDQYLHEKQLNIKDIFPNIGSDSSTVKAVYGVLKKAYMSLFIREEKEEARHLPLEITTKIDEKLGKNASDENKEESYHKFVHKFRKSEVDISSLGSSIEKKEYQLMLKGLRNIVGRERYKIWKFNNKNNKEGNTNEKLCLTEYGLQFLNAMISETLLYLREHKVVGYEELQRMLGVTYSSELLKKKVREKSFTEKELYFIFYQLVYPNIKQYDQDIKELEKLGKNAFSDEKQLLKPLGEKRRELNIRKNPSFEDINNFILEADALVGDLDKKNTQEREKLKTALQLFVEKKEKNNRKKTVMTGIKNLALANAYIKNRLDLDLVKNVEKSLSNWFKEQFPDDLVFSRSKSIGSLMAKELFSGNVTTIGREGIHGATDMIGTRTILEGNDEDDYDQKVEKVEKSMLEYAKELLENPPTTEIDGKKYTIRPKAIFLDSKIGKKRFQKETVEKLCKKLNEALSSEVKEVYDENYTLFKPRPEKKNGKVSFEKEYIDCISDTDEKMLVKLFEKGQARTGSNGNYEDIKWIIDYDLVDNKGNIYEGEKAKGGREHQRQFSNHENEKELSSHFLLDPGKFNHVFMRVDMYIGLKGALFQAQQGVEKWFDYLYELHARVQGGAKPQEGYSKKQFEYDKQQLEKQRKFTFQYAKKGGYSKEIDIIDLLTSMQNGEQEEVRKYQKAIAREFIRYQIQSKKMFLCRYTKNPDALKGMEIPCFGEEFDDHRLLVSGNLKIEQGFATRNLHFIIPDEERTNRRVKKTIPLTKLYHHISVAHRKQLERYLDDQGDGGINKVQEKTKKRLLYVLNKKNPNDNKKMQ